MRSFAMVAAAVLLVLVPAGGAGALGGQVAATGTVLVTYFDNFQPDQACTREATVALAVNLARGSGVMAETYPLDAAVFSFNCGLTRWVFDPDLTPVEATLDGWTTSSGGCTGSDPGTVTCVRFVANNGAYQITTVTLEPSGAFHSLDFWASLDHEGHVWTRVMDGTLVRV